MEPIPLNAGTFVLTFVAADFGVASGYYSNSGSKRSNSQRDFHRQQPSEACSMRGKSSLPLRQLSLPLLRPLSRVRMYGGIYTAPHTASYDIVVGLRVGFVDKTCAGGFK